MAESSARALSEATIAMSLMLGNRGPGLIDLLDQLHHGAADQRELAMP